MAKKQYGNDSISSLNGPDRVRKKPAVIFGSSDLNGCAHSFFEILSNSIDEAREGYGDHITVTRYLDKSIEVTDHGRGIPVDFNEKEQRYNWELVFCELYASGKYNTNEAENYEYSLGTNGMGACATQCASEFMDVTVMRDGYKYSLHFEKGYIVGEMQKEPTRFKQTGTSIRWRPDLEVFTDIDIPLEYYLDVMKRQAVVNPNLKLTLYDETREGKQWYEFCYPTGLVDYIKERTGDTALTQVQYFEAERRGRDREDLPEYKVKASLGFCFSNKVVFCEFFHNSSFLPQGGAPEKAVRLAMTASIDQYIRQTGKYQKNETKITFGDVSESLAYVSSSFSTYAAFESQTKKSVHNKFLQEMLADLLRQQMDVYLIENKDEAEKIALQVLANKRSRESAERARVSTKKKLTGSMDVTNRVQKFVDCRSKDVEKREVYIVEGDSALGSCKQGRDAEFQAIIPIRGKILNCLKADYDKIFKSEIITDLLRVLGCGVEVQNKHNKEFNSFDPELLRWNKVIICTDADVDGYQIRTLVLTMIYRLVPSLIEMGKVYIAESPLFEITHKDETYFAYTEAEKTQILEKLEGKKVKIQRSKGLGENEPEMMWQTTMNPETRRLIRVDAANMEETEMMFDLLLGDNLQGRKDYIAEFGEDYIDMADVS